MDGYKYVGVTFGELQPFAIHSLETRRAEFEHLGFRCLGLYSLPLAVPSVDRHYCLTFTGDSGEIYASVSAVRQQRKFGGIRIPFIETTGKVVTNLMLQTLLSSGKRLVTTTMSPPPDEWVPEGWMYMAASASPGEVLEEHRKRRKKLVCEAGISVVPVHSQEDYLLFPERYRMSLPNV